MQINIGENIKNLRKKTNLTQKELGELLSVSHQTVSSWESGKRTPDAQMLPLIADILHVTIDELFYNRISKQQSLENQIREEYQSLFNKGDYESARKLIENAHEQLPQSFFITSKYILHTVRDKDINDATKLEYLSNDIINNCNDKRIVHDTIHDMVVYYSSVNMHTKAMSLAESQPNIWCAGETLSCIAASKDELQLYIARAIYSNLKVLLQYCGYHTKILPPKRAAQSLERYVKVINTCFEGINLSEFHSMLCTAYTQISQCYALSGELEKAFQNLEMAAKHYIAFFSKEHHSFEGDDWFNILDFKTGSTNDLPYDILRINFNSDEFQTLTSDNRYEKIVSRAEKTAEKFKF